MSGDFCHREGTGAMHVNGDTASRAIAQRKNGAGTGLVDAGPRPADRESQVDLSSFFFCRQRLVRQKTKKL